VNDLDRDGWGVLHHLASKKCPNLAMLMMLIGFGADINLRSSMGETPLIIASHYCHAEGTKLLLQLGAAADVEDNNENSALKRAKASYMATSDEAQRAVVVLLEQGLAAQESARKDGGAGQSTNVAGTAARLREEGNEAYRNGKFFPDALELYSRSLEVIEDHRTFANRCACYLKIAQVRRLPF
jgi:ankyrin repeat protein